MGKVNIKQLNVAPASGYVIGSGAGGVPVWKLEVTSVAWNQITGNQALVNLSGFTNDSGFITLGSLSAGTGISYNNLTGVITNTAPSVSETLSNDDGTGIFEVHRIIQGGSELVGYYDSVQDVYSNVPPLYIIITGQSNASPTESGGDSTPSQYTSIWNPDTELWQPINVADSFMNGAVGRNWWGIHIGREAELLDKRLVRILFWSAGGEGIASWVNGNAKAFFDANVPLCGIPRIDAVCWYQGEFDYLSPAATYETAFNAVLTNFAVYSEWRDVSRFITCQIAASAPYDAQNVLFHKLSIGSNNFIELVETKDLTLTDGLHISGPSYITLGRRIYNTIKRTVRPFEVVEVFNAVTGYQINGGATLGNYLRGNGTNFVSSALLASDVSGTFQPAKISATNNRIFYGVGGVAAQSSHFTYDGTTMGVGNGAGAINVGDPTVGAAVRFVGAADGNNAYIQAGRSTVDVNAELRIARFSTLTTNIAKLAVYANASEFFGTISGTSTINAATGYKVNGAATSGNYLRGDGTNFVSSALQPSDFTFTTNRIPYGIAGVLGSSSTFTYDGLTMRVGNTDGVVLIGDPTAGPAFRLYGGGAGTVAYMQAGKSSGDLTAELRISRYLTPASTIALFNVYAEASSFSNTLIAGSDISITSTTNAYHLGIPTVNDTWRIIRIGNNLEFQRRVGGTYILSTTETVGAGLLNATTGYRVNNAATSGTFLRGNGTNYVSSTLLSGDINAALGASSPSASAVLQSNSTTQGWLPPRMTATQGSAIASPAEGLLIYVTDTNGTFTTKGWWGYNGAAWQQL